MGYSKMPAKEEYPDEMAEEGVKKTIQPIVDTCWPKSDLLTLDRKVLKLL